MCDRFPKFKDDSRALCGILRLQHVDVVVRFHYDSLRALLLRFELILEDFDVVDITWELHMPKLGLFYASATLWKSTSGTIILGHQKSTQAKAQIRTSLINHLYNNDSRSPLAAFAAVTTKKSSMSSAGKTLLHDLMSFPSLYLGCAQRLQHALEGVP